MPPHDALLGEPQTCPAVLMIRPARFGGNAQTRGSNYFQSDSETAGADAATQARHEFDSFAARLAIAGVHVAAFGGRRDEPLPDEVFPNNWLSLHADGTAVLYPLMAENRRPERRVALLDALRERGFRIERVVDLTWLERRGHYLEGTGSLVLDRSNRIAYACRSPRTHPAALAVFGRELGYEIVEFAALDRSGRPIYHTNVVMSVGIDFAVLCSQAIGDVTERRRLRDRLDASGREIVDLSLDQLHAFAGNLLELRGRGPVIAMSLSALRSLTVMQRAILERHGEIVAAELGCIERAGGGSARCMLAEIACPRLASG
jgi:hypothetical protein